MTETQTPAETLLAAAEKFFYLNANRYSEKVTYTAGPSAEVFTAAAHDWLPEFTVENSAGKIVGRRKTAAGALKLLVNLADAAYIGGARVAA